MKTTADNAQRQIQPPVQPAVKRKVKPSTVFLHLALILGSLVMAGPFIWMGLSSLKSFEQMFSIPPTIIPDPIMWSNFVDSLNAMPFGRAYWNSFYISTIVVLSQIITCSMAAYAFAKLKFPGSKVLFIAFFSNDDGAYASNTYSALPYFRSASMGEYPFIHHCAKCSL